MQILAASARLTTDRDLCKGQHPEREQGKPDPGLADS